MFHWVAENSKFSAEKWRFDNIYPYSSVAISNCNLSLLIYCRLKTNFIAKSQLLYMGCPLTRSVNKRKIQFLFSKELIVTCLEITVAYSFSIYCLVKRLFSIVKTNRFYARRKMSISLKSLGLPLA